MSGSRCPVYSVLCNEAVCAYGEDIGSMSQCVGECFYAGSPEDVQQVTGEPRDWRRREAENMTGAEHYAAAENALECALRTEGALEAFHLASAQAHATLALAAATAGYYGSEQQP